MANFSYFNDGQTKRETMIVFVYDTECCKDEADDPVDAVLYFHPSWVSDVQKLSLCGQLMGTTHFLSESFFKPKIISLQSGKFILKEFGRYILAIGTDRNLSEYLLEHRADLLTSLLKFFHRDIQTIHDQFLSSSSATTTSNMGQYKNLSEKLYHIFETYLPILQYNGNVFQNVPTLRLPKSSSNIFLDSIQTLQSCQQIKGVLGGAILYHNKVVATQLSSDITKNLVLTDPYRIKSTAEQISVDFHVPIGVQMIVVYISQCDYRKLIQDSQKSQNVITQNLPNNNHNNTNPPIPYQYQKRKVKRDKSIIFSNIPEEGSCEQSSTGVENQASTTATSSIKMKPLNRPNHLPLRFKNVTTKDMPESGFASINFDETDSYPEFIGRTSVCSTPMTENKILHDNIMSICANPTENLILKDDKNDKNIIKCTNSNVDIQQKNKSHLVRIDFEKFFSNFASNPYKLERRNSLMDLHDSLKKNTKRLSLHPFGIGLAKLGMNKQHQDLQSYNDDETSDYVDDIHNRKPCRTITDPTCPVFKSDGEPISNSLFQEFLQRYSTSWNGDDDKVDKFIEDFKEFDCEISKINVKENENNLVNEENEIKENLDKIENFEKSLETKQNRRSLSLPLKPLNIESNDQTVGTSNIFERKKLSGIQLTPLMAKLSILALNEERSSGFCSWDTTPGMELATPSDGMKMFRRRSSIRMEDTVDNLENGFQKVELYICGQQNTTLLLILENGAGQKQELVQALFDTCVSRLTRLETNLNQTLNINVDADKSEGGYSYICVDPKWDTVQRGGPWSPSDLISLQFMHKDLNMTYPITDMLLRTEDSVLYGYKCGRTQVFYKQIAHSQSGLPPPADTMGTVALRAKRRLERDHAFILF